MNILEQIQLHKEELTPREMKVYNLVMSNPINFSSSTTSQIAATYHISQSSISRFCQKVGFNSFSEFRMALYASSISTKYSASTSEDTLLEEMPSSADHDLVYYMCEQVKAIKSTLSDSLLDSLVEQFIHSSSVYVTGVAYSSIPAQLLTQQLVLASIPAHYVPSGSDVEMLHVTKCTDTFIMFSAFNSTHEDFFNAVKEIPVQKRPYTILITLSARHPLRKMADKTVCIPNWSALRYPMAIDPSFTTGTFCNLLSSHLMNYISER